MGYSPTLGRCLERDPEEYIDGMNVYLYEVGNPLRHLDPLGTTIRTADVGPVDALGHWRIGGGESVHIVGAEFREHVMNIPDVRTQLDWLKQDLAKKAEANGKELKACECKEVQITRARMSATMTGYRWGAFGTIYHDAVATVTVCKDKEGVVTTKDEKLHVYGYDVYHNFEMVPWGFRHIW